MLASGHHNDITDVPGVEVGQATDERALTGVTVVLTRTGAVAGVDVRGAAPGTRETDLLDPENLVQQVQAIVLSGGSAFGLDAAGGVMRYLEEQSLGQDVGNGRVVPIVPAAVIFDLDVGSCTERPDAGYGFRAALAATHEQVEQGNVGVGAGARAGGLKGGLGSASAVMSDGLVAGALAVVNSVGRPHDPATGELHGRGLELGSEFGGLPAADPAVRRREGEEYSDIFPAGGPLPGRNTTLAVVATNARLDKSQARRLAQMAHDGIARAILPAHTMFDGDTVFALATGDRELTGPAELARLGAVIADTLTRAIVRGVLAAKSVPSLQCYRDAFPNPPEDRG